MIAHVAPSCGFSLDGPLDHVRQRLVQRTGVFRGQHAAVKHQPVDVVGVAQPELGVISKVVVGLQEIIAGGGIVDGVVGQPRAHIDNPLGVP